MNPNPPRQPIITDQFLANCLFYEFQKNKTCCRLAYKNFCGMMISEVIRDEVLVQPDEPRPFRQRDRRIIPRLKKWFRKSVEGIVPDPEPHVISPRGENILNRFDSDFGLIPPKLINTDDSDLENDDSDMTLLKNEEKEVEIRSLDYGKVKNIFKELEKGMKQLDAYAEDISTSKSFLHLTELRDWAFFFRTLTIVPRHRKEKQFMFPYNQAKVTIDFDKVKIVLTHHFVPNYIQRMEFWKDSEGCWTWFNDSVSFIRGYTYETIAAFEFVYTIVHSYTYNVPFEELQFDIDDLTSWNMGRRHNTHFFHKIRRTMIEETEVAKTKKFTMKLWKDQEKKDHPFKLRLLDFNVLETICIQLWDDGSLTKPEYPQSLEQLQETPVWRNAKELDLTDERLDWRCFRFSLFEKVHLSEVKDEEIMDLMEIFKKQLPRKKCVVRVNSDLDINKLFGIYMKYFKKEHLRFRRRAGYETMTMTFEDCRYLSVIICRFDKLCYNLAFHNTERNF